MRTLSWWVVAFHGWRKITYERYQCLSWSYGGVMGDPGQHKQEAWEEEMALKFGELPLVGCNGQEVGFHHYVDSDTGSHEVWQLCLL